MLALLCFILSASLCWALPPRPHLVFIVADDLGWNDIGYHNPDIISPTIDTLAYSGIILNQTYVQPLCSPSRSAILTGVYPFRLGTQHLVILNDQEVCVPLTRSLLPQVLKSNGYNTHMVGKWHLGFCKWECTPTFRGFDTYYGYYNADEDYYSKITDKGIDFRINTTVGKEAVGNYSAYQYATRAEEIIKSHDPDTPLFLYLPFQNVHEPLEVPNKYLKLYPNISDENRRNLSAMVTALDDAIARVVTALKTYDLYNNTLIVFTADNGGWTLYGGNNYPLRGGKFTIFEGGTRVPAFLHGPMLQTQGKVYNGMMHAVDWFATLVKALNISYN
ncbi:arylsulfatase B, partial [Biomphalaria pfeifferi]